MSMGPSQARELAATLADLLDRRFRLPGTDVRVGIDPLLGLIPGAGDAIAGVLGSFIVYVAAAQGVPRITLVRMALNIALNGLLGAIPVAGDLFSFWFKSNVRNLELLERHAPLAGQGPTAPDWGFVLGLLVVLAALVAGSIAALVWFVKLLWYALPAGS
ncbi:MAG: DUF4112 domain-containing protein [Deltaproteobacteria bacterium]|nr:DUF4112 domain-containing protein [Deltaproteobacteria bacterium]